MLATTARFPLSESIVVASYEPVKNAASRFSSTFCLHSTSEIAWMNEDGVNRQKIRQAYEKKKEHRKVAGNDNRAASDKRNFSSLKISSIRPRGARVMKYLISCHCKLFLFFLFLQERIVGLVMRDSRLQLV